MHSGLIRGHTLFTKRDEPWFLCALPQNCLSQNLSKNVRSFQGRCIKYAVRAISCENIEFSSPRLRLFVDSKALSCLTFTDKMKAQRKMDVDSMRIAIISINGVYLADFMSKLCVLKRFDCPVRISSAICMHLSGLFGNEQSSLAQEIALKTFILATYNNSL